MRVTSLKEFIPIIEAFKKNVTESYNGLNMPQFEQELTLLKRRLEDPQFWQDEEKLDEMRQMQTKIAALERKVTSWRQLKEATMDLAEYVEIAVMEKAEALLKEIDERYNQLETQYNQLDLESLLDEPDDYRNAFLNIHPGAGGTESHDWADMLYRAYVRWAEKEGFKVNVVDFQDGDEAGIKNVTLLIEGPNAYGYLKAENGIHRLVRISPFDSNAKRHTSFVSVHVSPEISDEVQVEINDKDLRIDTYRASGAGGQHINKTDSAIRITHFPTGIVVSCQNERSQIKNRATAFKMLKARLYEIEKERIDKEIESKAGERKDIAWGSQIRSYVFHPYNMVKDVRTGYETSNVHGVMDGDFNPFIDAFLRLRKTHKLGA